MQAYMRATSSTERAIGPIVSKVGLTWSAPRLETTPDVGRRPLVPQRADGIRIDPPVSVPSAPTQRSAASAAAEPPLEPPAIRPRSHGFRQAPNGGGFVVVAP